MAVDLVAGHDAPPYLPRAACAVVFLKLKRIFWTSLMWWIVEVMETVDLLPVAAAYTITARP
jgi:hypothetical protein